MPVSVGKEGMPYVLVILMKEAVAFVPGSLSEVGVASFIASKRSLASAPVTATEEGVASWLVRLLKES